jgi:ammonia channel protein AmtB
MWATKVFALLLPLGVWLILSAAIPRSQTGRAAASGLIAVAVSTLLFCSAGFGFMFGGVGSVSHIPELSRLVTFYTIPVANQAWGLIGLRGFFLNDIPGNAGADLFVTYLPLVATAALLVVGMLVRRTGLVAQAMVAGVVAGLIVPVAGFWVWGGGWLSTLGINMSMGHGVADFGGLTTAALAAGGAGLAWLLIAPRRASSETPDLPSTFNPFQALSGAVCVAIGATAFVAGNPLYAAFADKAAGVMLMHILLAAAVAGLLALTYSFFVTRRPNMVVASRAVLATVIALAAGGIVLPVWAVLVLGLAAGALATAGLYLTREKLRWLDENGLVGVVLLPALLGLAFTGLFANGAFGQGLNGIGADSYLGVANLGVVGAMAGAQTDSGQLTAQLAAAGAIVAFAFLIFAPFAFLFRRSVVAQPSGAELAEAEQEAGPEVATETEIEARAEPAMPEQPTRPARPPRPAPVEPPTLIETAAPHLATPLAPVAQQIPENKPAPSLRELASAFISRNGHSNGTAPADQPAPVERKAATAPASGSQNGSAGTPANGSSHGAKEQAGPQRESLLDRLRRARTREQQPEPPSQARHVAYPTRVGGRRVAIRPMPAPNASNDDSQPDGSSPDKGNRDEA